MLHSLERSVLFYHIHFNRDDSLSCLNCQIPYEVTVTQVVLALCNRVSKEYHTNPTQHDVMKVYCVRQLVTVVKQCVMCKP